MGIDLISVNTNEDHTIAGDDFRSAVILALYSIVTELIPLYTVIEPRFVKIFSMNFLQSATTEETELDAEEKKEQDDEVRPVSSPIKGLNDESVEHESPRQDSPLLPGTGMDKDIYNSPK